MIKKRKKIATQLAARMDELSKQNPDSRGISIATGTATIQNYVAFNIKDTTKEAKVIESFKKLEKQVGIEIEGKDENKLTFRGVFASFLFIGVFISLIFVTSQVVIMYYKQISEGYATIVCNVAIISGEKKINSTCDLIDCLICLSVIPTFLMISKLPLSSYPSEICL